MMGIAFWFLYLGWLAFFVWLGWRQFGRALGVLGALLVIVYIAFHAWTMKGAGEPGWHAGGSFAAGMMVGFAAFLLVAPVLLGIIAFLAKKLWNRV